MKLSRRNNISLSFSGKCQPVSGRVGVMRGLATHPCRTPVPAPLDVTYTRNYRSSTKHLDNSSCQNLTHSFREQRNHGLGIEIALWAVETCRAAQGRTVAYHPAERGSMRRSYVLNCDNYSDYATVAAGHICC